MKTIDVAVVDRIDELARQAAVVALAVEGLMANNLTASRYDLNALAGAASAIGDGLRAISDELSPEPEPEA